jgi:hypothetical protein
VPLVSHWDLDGGRLVRTSLKNQSLKIQIEATENGRLGCFLGPNDFAILGWSRRNRRGIRRSRDGRLFRLDLTARHP